MPDLIRTAQYFKVQIADQPGTLAGILSPLREAGQSHLLLQTYIKIPALFGRQRHVPEGARDL